MMKVETTCDGSLISRKCSITQAQPYSIAEGHKIEELYEFSNDSTMIKCFERSTVERIEENSNDVSRCLFICTHNTLNTAMGKRGTKS